MDEEGVDGFIMPDGAFVDLDDAEAMLKIAKASLRTQGEIAENMIALAIERAGKGRSFAAYGYFQKALEQSDTCQMKAFCLLALGQLKEHQEDYAGAMEWYRQAFDMEPGNDDTWYLLNNNLGFCLNQLGRHAEGAEVCRRAVEIDPRRHNAHKNLGIALEGLGRHAAAATAYLRAAENCHEDPRAFLLLKSLIRSHPEIKKAIPDFRIRIEALRVNPGASLN